MGHLWDIFGTRFKWPLSRLSVGPEVVGAPPPGAEAVTDPPPLWQIIQDLENSTPDRVFYEDIFADLDMNVREPTESPSRVNLNIDGASKQNLMAVNVLFASFTVMLL